MRGRTEAGEQKAVIEWCAWQGVPVVHIPNEGKRDPRTGAELKAMGMQAGFPDLLIPVIRGGFGGLFVEMKRDSRSRVSSAQRYWLERLNAAGYMAIVCRGADEAIRKIMDYIRGTDE